MGKGGLILLLAPCIAPSMSVICRVYPWMASMDGINGWMTFLHLWMTSMDDIPPSMDDIHG